MPGTVTYPASALATALWHDPVSLLRIEYAPAAMEAVRSLTAVGQPVGGLLLGERAGAHVRILDSAELPCSYTRGPSFRLTPDERARGRELVETARLQVVGWYVSRTGDEPGLTGEDLEIYRDLFPAQWQITLVLRVCADRGITAAFYSPNRAGDLMKGSEQVLPAAPVPEMAAWPVPVGSSQIPDRVSLRSWVTMAVIAMLLGAAAFEAQTLWQMHEAADVTSRPAAGAEIP